MLIVSELGEGLEALRKNNFSDKKELDIIFKHGSNILFGQKIKDTFEDEMADAIIRIADLCGYLKIDLEKHVLMKMKYNCSREQKHGKKF